RRERVAGVTETPDMTVVIFVSDRYDMEAGVQDPDRMAHIRGAELGYSLNIRILLKYLKKFFIPLFIVVIDFLYAVINSKKVFSCPDQDQGDPVGIIF